MSERELLTFKRIHSVIEDILDAQREPPKPEENEVQIPTVPAYYGRLTASEVAEKWKVWLDQATEKQDDQKIKFCQAGYDKYMAMANATTA
jgi:hypothetical protein